MFVDLKFLSKHDNALDILLFLCLPDLLIWVYGMIYVVVSSNQMEFQFSLLNISHTDETVNFW